MTSTTIVYKIILVGNTTVGKTSFFKKIITGEFSDKNMSTIGVDRTTIYSELEINKNGKLEKTNFEIILYDSAGQEQFRAITKSYYKQADGILLLYDVTNRKSFEQIKIWIDSLEETLGENKKDKYIVALFGNKIDLEKENGSKVVDESEAKEKCKESGFLWGGEISVKTFTKEQLIEKINIFIQELYKTIGCKKFGTQLLEKPPEKKKKKKICFFFA